MSKKHLVFICYACEDRPRVIPIYQYLKNNCIDPWMDIFNILPGENWDYAIKCAIAKADFILVCLSKNFVTKRGYVQKEVKRAFELLLEQLDEDIYLIPVLLEECSIPVRFSDIQVVKIYESDGWERLLGGLKAGISRKKC